MTVWLYVALDLVTTTIAFFLLFLYFSRQRKKEDDRFGEYIRQLEEKNERIYKELRKQNKRKKIKG